MEHGHDSHSRPATFYLADLPEDPACAHEVRFPDGDSTSEVFQ